MLYIIKVYCLTVPVYSTCTMRGRTVAGRMPVICIIFYP